MKLRTAAVYVFLGSSLHLPCMHAQSIPVGQITRQLTKPQSDAVATFKEELKTNLKAPNAVPQEDVSNMLESAGNAKNLSGAVSNAMKNLPQTSRTARDQARNAITTAKANVPAAEPCSKNSDGSYAFQAWFPTVACFNNNDAINYFFDVSKGMAIANTVGYLYNPNQSTNQITSDLFTGTFSQGFQTILSGTATQGSSQPSSSAPSTSTTDSVSTAISKLEQGGDFNVRFPFPILFKKTSSSAIYMLTSPNAGFMVNGSSGQNTITESTEYNVNLPLEFWAETTSIPTQSGSVQANNNQSGNVVMYLDVKPALEIVSPSFASAVGLKSSRYFFLGQAAAGLSFFQSVRVGFQYYFGPSQVYQVPSPTGTGTTTKTGKVGGVHLVVSFSPNKSK